jgi:hypothetical protein
MRAALLVLLLGGCATPTSFFVGTWSGESQFASGQKTKLTWTVSKCGDDCLEGKSQAPAFEMTATDQWTRQGDRFSRAYSDWQGTKGTLHSRGWVGDVWVWEGELDEANGSKTTLRETITRLDQRTFHAKYEQRTGDAWVPFSEETLQRAP